MIKCRQIYIGRLSSQAPSNSLREGETLVALILFMLSKKCHKQWKYVAVVANILLSVFIKGALSDVYVARYETSSHKRVI